MQDKIDYLAHERKNHPEGSINAMLKELIQGVRYIRSIPGDQIRSNMPPLWDLEEKLQDLDAQIGDPKREYIQEIMEALNNEPELDEAKTYSVCEMKLDSNNEVSFMATGRTFFQNDIAEEWVSESGDPGKKYVIFEVLTQKTDE